MRDPDFGLTALHYGCKMGKLRVVEVLCNYGADINARAPDGRTPLHFAAAYGTKEVVLELLARGADLNARDDFNCTAIQLAEQNQNRRTFSTLDNWLRLLPPAEEEEEEEEHVDLSHIAEEFLSTPEEVLNAMGKELQLLCRRLDSNDLSGKSKHSQDVKMDPLVELRLCEKFSKLCQREGFAHEALKGAKRRWGVAKRLCLPSPPLSFVSLSQTASMSAPVTQVQSKETAAGTNDRDKDGSSLDADVTTRSGAQPSQATHTQVDSTPPPQSLFLPTPPPLLPTIWQSC